MTATSLRWRKSTFSGASHECVEVAPAGDGRVLVRNSNRPDAGTLAVAAGSMAAWVGAAGTGQLDDLAR
jgi:hypothetical protein